MSKHTASDTVLRRHPIQGALWGAPLGAGIALHLLGFGIISFGAWPLLGAPVAGSVFIGIVWGSFGPARAPKGRISPDKRSSGAAAAERRSAAEVRAHQLMAARQANEELHGLAAEDDDNAMQKALHEAEKDVIDIVVPRTNPGPAKPRRVVTTKRVSTIDVTKPTPEPVPSSAAESTDNALIDLVSVTPAVDAPPGAPQPEEPELLVSEAAGSSTDALVPASPPLSLVDPAEVVGATVHAEPTVIPTLDSPPLSLTSPVQAQPVNALAPAAPEASPPAAVPTQLPPTPAVPTVATPPAPTDQPVSLTTLPSNATTPVPPASAEALPDLRTPASAEPVVAPPATPAAAAATPPVATAQDLTPFENSPLPSDADEEQAAADKLEAQLDAALREAVAVTLDAR